MAIPVISRERLVIDWAAMHKVKRTRSARSISKLELFGSASSYDQRDRRGPRAPDRARQEGADAPSGSGQVILDGGQVAVELLFHRLDLRAREPIQAMEARASDGRVEARPQRALLVLEMAPQQER